MKKNVFLSMLLMVSCLIPAIAQISSKQLYQPDVSKWRSPGYGDDFFKDHYAKGIDALNYWMQSYNWRSNRTGIVSKKSNIELLLSGDTSQARLANVQIQNMCRLILSDPVSWGIKNNLSRTPVIWIELALRVPDKLTPETLGAVKAVLAALNISGKSLGYIGWINGPGSNGSNVHGYLTPLLLAPAIINDPNVSAAGKQGLLNELAHMNGTGDVQEYNLLESHWTGVASWEIMKRYIPDPKLRRIARMVTERLWINRFLTWSAKIERITGPGSRMAPSEWLGTDGERALFATAVNRPIWLNFYFPWDGWDSRKYEQAYEEIPTEATVPDLPAYLQDLVWYKSLPNQLECNVTYKGGRKPFPLLPGVHIGDSIYHPAFKYINYQTENYTIGSSTSSWVVNTCPVVACAWWNSSRTPEAPTGSPERFCVLYPHYVFNGMSTLDKGDLFFESAPDKPLTDDKGGPGGPWLREFADYGRIGCIQDKNAMIISYSGRPGATNAGQVLVKSKTKRASAAMFLFRWKDGLDGLYVNKTSVKSLPAQLLPGDWWFIEDGDTYCAVLPLKATKLKGNCKITLEKRNHHIVLYEDNVTSDNIEGISNEQWIKAQSGFVVEMGGKKEYGSFAQFQNKILSGMVETDKADGFIRSVSYARDNHQLAMQWNCYTEHYTMRQINGNDDQWTRFLKSPEFSLSDSGKVIVKDASVTTKPGKTVWLLSCPESKNWITYQSNPGNSLPIDFSCPMGRFIADKFPFGKVVVHQYSVDTINIDIDENYEPLNSTYEFDLNSSFKNCKIAINGIYYKPKIRNNKGKIAFIIYPDEKTMELLNESARR